MKNHMNTAFLALLELESVYFEIAANRPDIEKEMKAAYKRCQRARCAIHSLGCIPEHRDWLPNVLDYTNITDRED